MRPLYLVLIIVVVAILLIAGFVWFAKPTVALPPINVPMQANSPLIALKHQLGVDQLDLRTRTNGTVSILADGSELGYLSYNPATLKNATNVATNLSLSPNLQTGMKLVPYIFPGLASNAFLTAQAVYYALPFEIIFRIVES